MDMNQREIQKLIDKYNALSVDLTELQEIERLIEAGMLDVAQLTDLKLLDDRLFEMKDPSPSRSLDDRFYQMLADEQQSSKQVFSWKRLFGWPEFAPKLTLASIALGVGLVIGLIINLPRQDKKEVKMLTQEVSDLKEMIMLSMLQKESATERLRAVSLAEEMDVSSKVTNALLQTLNNDPNVNVRLAALDALHPYVRDNHVREELVRSIAKQESPLVQISLAELMAAIQEKASVNELQKVLQNDKTPIDVKKKIKESIQILT